MKNHYIDMDGKWAIVLCYDYDMLDMDRMAALMHSMGSSDKSIRKSMNILFGMNTGMTISRSDYKMSLMFIGNATSIEEFVDTATHEADHVQSAMCDYYGIPYGSEEAAYLQGDIMREITHCLVKDNDIRCTTNIKTKQS